MFLSIRDKRANEMQQNLRFHRIDSRLALCIRIPPKQGMQTGNKHS